jgi:hypothetical protein
MDDQPQTILAPDALGFQDGQESGPFLVVFAVAQVPEQDFTAVRVGPNTHGDEKGALESAFNRPLAALSVTTHLAIRTHLRHPESVYV